MLMLPMLACSQNDLGFWEGTPEKLDGCKLWAIQTNDCEFCSSYVTYTDCYGNTKEYRATDGFVTDGRAYELCSMDRPVAMNNTPPFNGIASITQTGWCTDPIGSSFPFWIETTFPLHTVKTIEILSSDDGGTNRNQVFLTNTVTDIAGYDNAVTINDPYVSQGFYVLRVTASSIVSPGSLRIHIRPGDGQVLVFTNFNYDETKEIIIEKREFHLAI